MNKILSLLALTAGLFVATPSMAQTGTVTATVVDAETNDTVIGAVLTVTSGKTPAKEKYFTSGYNGAVSMTGLAYGDYSLSVTFIGYDTLRTTFSVSAAKQNLGKLMMKTGSVQIDAVVKEVKSIRTSQKGDTVSYNAGAFKVTADADVSGLLQKMPGITVSGDGAVKAQGEDVKKVFVDGKEFFGDDVTSAIKSLPAQAVDKVEVYNKLSDQAEFSGMDDGEGYKAINIVTHREMRQGQFGKLYAGYGYEPNAEENGGRNNKYIVGGNVNIFSGTNRLTILGLFNNINQQNFSFEDIIGVSGTAGAGGGRRGMGQYMVRPQSGVASANAIGINYSGIWGKKQNINFQGSYFFNNTNTYNNSTVRKWYELPNPIDTLETDGYSRNINYNHRLNARIEWKISDNQSLMIRPSVSFQKYDSFSTTTGRQFGQSGYSLIDNLSNAMRDGYNIRTTAIYRLKLGKPGRTLTVDGSFNYRHSDRTQNSYSNVADPYFPYPFDPATPPTDDDLRDMLYQRIMTPTDSYSVWGSVTYTEPISKSSQISLQYRPSYEYDKQDKRAYVTGSDFSTDGILPDPLLSNYYSSSYLKNSIGPGFRYAKNKNTLVANVYYQRSTLDGQVISGDAEAIRHSYDNVTYFFMGQFNINSENSLRLFARSSTNNPDVGQLQSIYDLSDARYISRGNPDLRPTYSHRVFLTYNNSNVERGRTLLVSLMMNATSNYISSQTVFNPTINVGDTEYKPLQFTQPVNLDGYWTVSADVNYGIPLGFIKSNLNILGGVTYSNIPTMVGGNLSADGVLTGGERNDVVEMVYRPSVVLGSNISENVDFTISWNSEYHEAKNSLGGSGTKNRYFNQSVSASMKFVFWKGFSFSGSVAYTQNMGFTNNYNDQYVLCNLYLGKKIFRNQRGEISIGVNDVFNQNKAFSRSIGSGYSQNMTNSVIGRYYSVQFVYNLRRFGKKGSTNAKDYDGAAETRSSKEGVGMSRSSSTPTPPRGHLGRH